VPVVTNGVVKGIISDRDVRRALGWAFVRDAQAEAEGNLMESEPQSAAEVMQTPVLTISSSATLRQALRLMVDRRIHCLPVVENARLVGMITQTDLIRAIALERLL
jgi:CBS domain-containing protein